jgi:hypothetical protein
MILKLSVLRGSKTSVNAIFHPQPPFSISRRMQNVAKGRGFSAAPEGARSRQSRVLRYYRQNQTRPCTNGGYKPPTEVGLTLLFALFA